MTENRNNIAAQPDVAAPSSAAASDAEEPQALFVPVIVTAALLVIGNEILSGRTKDRNIGHIAEVLTGIGIDL
ncbi:MAG: hypothetical protein ACXW3U_09615, partial [Rhodoplanes sp.]